ncbi:hypothetical protein RFI_18558 [Reticulomyxa filosa]|uniref:ERCC1-like central domain-containing protein n=1 Tax=Reticulomyxa filosa TaxID=46433 RepID=X6MYI5_RETFI|nr:hypothetical protein RFI_18558 [Reticulomyxa filosa]|eukprot:ETO18698.1 hypothetical protein RFI_18558 [Reticulomyxa filosa]
MVETLVVAQKNSKQIEPQRVFQQKEESFGQNRYFGTSVRLNKKKSLKMNTNTSTAGQSNPRPKVGENQNKIQVNPKQQLNHVLLSIRKVGFEINTLIEPDFVMGNSICALWLSIKYHKLHPNYIHGRIAQLKGKYTTRILLTFVDEVFAVFFYLLGSGLSNENE